MNQDENYHRMHSTSFFSNVKVETMCLRKGSCLSLYEYRNAVIEMKKKSNNKCNKFHKFILTIHDTESQKDVFSWELRIKKHQSVTKPYNFQIFTKLILEGRMTIVTKLFSNKCASGTKKLTSIPMYRGNLPINTHQILISSANKDDLGRFISILKYASPIQSTNISSRNVEKEERNSPSKRIKTSHQRRVPLCDISNLQIKNQKDSAKKRELQLSPQQSNIVNKCIQGENVFITGSAGTGKSFLIKHIVKCLRNRYIDASDKNAVHVTSTTGIGACGIGGVTIHHFAGINSNPPRAYEQIRLYLKRKPTIQKRWKYAKCLIIDEISMLDSALWLHLDMAARIARGRSKLVFGGLQIIVIGDFCQLPPVSSKRTVVKFAFQSESWRTCFHKENSIMLEKVFRQQQDSVFISILDRLRRGICTSKDLRRINDTCVGQKFDTSDGILPTKIYTHKKDVELVNSKMLEELCQKTGRERKLYKALDAVVTERHKKLLSDCPLLESLTIAIGAQVIVNRNISQTLVNGARGVVVSFHPSGLPRVRFVSQDCKQVFEEVIYKTNYSVIIDGAKVAKREQLPLNLGWAISVHKSQGMTIPRIEANLTKAFEYGQIYVALSRATSLSGFSLAVPLRESQPFCHPKVQEFYNFKANC